jgi:hypothetical protein
VGPPGETGREDGVTGGPGAVEAPNPGAPPKAGALPDAGTPGAPPEVGGSPGALPEAGTFGPEVSI